MEVFSLEFFAFLFIAIAFLTFRARKKRTGPVILQGKQISIRGQKISTPLNKSNPLPCLLDDGRSFGADFKEKEVPKLPHTEGCQCQISEIVQRSHELFNEKGKNKKIQETLTTDIGELGRDEYRYYKYLLIANHKDANEQIQSDYAELAANVMISEAAKERIGKLFVLSPEDLS